jgi:hypothetical protein
MYDRLVEIEGLGSRREDLILRRGGEGEPLALDVLLPALPGLQRDLVAALGQRAAERNSRECVSGIAEGA